MSDNYDRLMLNQRFLRIVDLILTENKNLGKSPGNDSELSRLLSNDKDRKLINKIRGGHQGVSQNQILKLANLFNIDFNAFYRDVPVVKFGKSEIWNDGRSMAVQPLEEQREKQTAKDWSKVLIDQLESTFRSVERFIEGIPEEFRGAGSSLFNGIETSIRKYQRIVDGEILQMEVMKREHAETLFALSSKLTKSQEQSLKYLQDYLSLKERVNG